MQQINRETKTSVYFGVSYLLAKPWGVDKPLAVEYQKNLLDAGLDFEQTSFQGASFVLTRRQASSLQVRLETPGPQVSAIHIIAQNPQYDMDMYVRDAEGVMSAFMRTFGAGNVQVLQSSAKLQHLYSCGDHAFKYLWENRLKQLPEDFKVLGRPVAGGGLRVVMPPHSADEQEPCSIELRIESMIREPKKLLVETVFVWPKPVLISSEKGFRPGELMTMVEAYAAEKVWGFIAQAG